MKDGWRNVPLGEVCAVIAGQSPDGSSYNSDGIGWPFYQGKKEFEEKFVGAPTTWTTEPTKIAEANDILMSVRAPVGPINFATQKICIGRGLAAIRAREGLKQEFLFYQLLSKQGQISGRDGAVFPSISRDDIRAVRLQIPPLGEQRRIAAILDEAFAGIATATANAETNLANAEAVYQREVDSIFSGTHPNWTDLPLGAAAAKVSTGPFGSLLHKSDYVSNGTPLVNPTNLRGGKITPDDTKTLSDQAATRLEAYRLRIGDVVIARRGELGRCAAIEADQDGWFCGTGCFFVRPSDRVSSHFLATLLSSNRYATMLERAAAGATIKNLSNEALRELPISIPTRDEQKRVLSRLRLLKTEVEELKSVYQAKVARLLDLKRSLLAKAFIGELKGPVAHIQVAAE